MYRHKQYLKWISNSVKKVTDHFCAVDTESQFRQVQKYSSQPSSCFCFGVNNDWIREKNGGKSKQNTETWTRT